MGDDSVAVGPERNGPLARADQHPQRRHLTGTADRFAQHEVDVPASLTIRCQVMRRVVADRVNGAGVDELLDVQGRRSSTLTLETSSSVSERTDPCGPLRLRSFFQQRIKIDFCHAFDLAADNGCIDLDRRGLNDVAPE
jgi:hypothetical protein